MSKQILSVLVVVTCIAFATGDAETTTKREIIRLIDDLDNSDQSQRERACRRLREIGRPTLLYLRHCPERDKVEQQRLALKLLLEIQEKHGALPSQANGLEFLACADRVWRIPAPGSSTPITIGLKVTNIGDKKVLFNTFDTIGFELDSPEGQALRGTWGRDGVPGRNYTPRLAKGESYTVTDFGVKLCRSEDGESLWLAGRTYSGWFFTFRGIKPGTYHVSFPCAHEEQVIGNDGTPMWFGRTALPPFVTVEIK